MIASSDLETLRSFDSNGRIILSAYLSLETAEQRESAHDDFVLRAKACLDQCEPQPECRQAIHEDMEIVSLYLKTNGHRRHAGLAIFSCAAEFFWRAYPLTFPVPTQVVVGPRFFLEPLTEHVLP